MPSSNAQREKILEIIQCLPKPKNIIDLGSGWGNFCFPLAKKYPEIKIIGYENSLVPWFFCKLRQLIFCKQNLSFEFRNFYQVDLSKADLIICYLFPGAMKRLSQKLKNELKPGAVIISNIFALPGWKPEKIYRKNDLIYLYKVLNHDSHDF